MEGGISPFTHRSMFAINGGWTGSSSSDLPLYLHYQGTGEPGPIQEIDEGGGTRYPESLLFPSTSSGPAGLPEDPERPYFCDTCGKRYSQPQSVLRHCRKAHGNSHSCFALRCKFKWTRPYHYRNHLVKRHRDVDPDNVLGKHAGSRRRSAIIGRDLPQHFPSPAIGPDPQSQAEPWQRLMTPPPPTVAEVTHSPVMSPMAYNPQPAYAEPAITTRKHEDARGLEFPGFTDTPSAFSSMEGRAQPVNPFQRGRFWSPPARPLGSAAADHPSSPVDLSPPVGRFHDSPVIVRRNAFAPEEHPYWPQQALGGTQ